VAQIGKARHRVLLRGALPSCPSWARTRTLLIQRHGHRAPISGKLLIYLGTLPDSAGLQTPFAGVCRANRVHFRVHVFAIACCPDATNLTWQLRNRAAACRAGAWRIERLVGGQPPPGSRNRPRDGGGSWLTGDRGALHHPRLGRPALARQTHNRPTPTSNVCRIMSVAKASLRVAFQPFQGLAHKMYVGGDWGMHRVDHLRRRAGSTLIDMHMMGFSLHWAGRSL
jgi:hypothetical protein